MMKKDTKQKILDAAIKLFNEQGYVNIRLQNIADEASISIGNLNYHFKHKIEILSAILDQIKLAQIDLLENLQLAPIFETFSNFLLQTFQLQKQYTFFFLDALEIIRTSKDLAIEQRQHVQWKERQFEFLILSYVARGAMVDFVNHELAGKIAKQLRRTIDGWMLHRFVEGENISDFNIFFDDIWLVFQPYLTKIGVEEKEGMNKMI